MTSSRLFSPTKKRDLELRQELLSVIEVALRWYEKTGDVFFLDGAKSLGETSATYKRRVESHDYSKEDSLEEKASSWAVELKKLSTTTK